MDKKIFEWKSMFFWFFHFNNFFVTPGQIPAIFNLQDQIFFRTLTQPKPPAFQNISSIFGNQYGKSFYSMAKLRKPIWLQSKRPKFRYFLGQKAVWRKIQFFFIDILKAVCLTFDGVPKLIQISFQAMEQKLVQRCETKVDVDACKASYADSSELSYSAVVINIYWGRKR